MHDSSVFACRYQVVLEKRPLNECSSSSSSSSISCLGNTHTHIHTTEGNAILQLPNSIFVVGLLHNSKKWVHRKCSGIKGSMYKVMKSFICRGCVNPVTGTGRTSVDIGGDADLELVDKFLLEIVGGSEKNHLFVGRLFAGWL